MKGIANWIVSVALTALIWLIFYYIQLWGGGQGRRACKEEKEEKEEEKEQEDLGVMDQDILEPYAESCQTSRVDVYLHFFWIFGCIYALSKFTELSERYLSAKIASKERSSDVRILNEKWEATLKHYELAKEQLDAELKALQKKNGGLEQSMQELRDCNLQLISENFMRSVLQDQQIQGLAQRVQDQQPSNVYITNRHIHLTRQVFLNDGHIDTFDSFDRQLCNVGGQELKCPDKSMNVWIQYLKMRKCYMGPIADPKLVLNGDPNHRVPIVMTTEQLAKLQEFYLNLGQYRKPS